MIALLTLFVGLQYTWLAQASVAEREQLQKRVETDTKAFADEFNREIQGAFLSFQVDAAVITTGDNAAFNERFDYWKGQTKYPELIKQIVYIPKTRTELLAYSTDKGVFETTPSSPELDAIRAELSNGLRRSVIEQHLALAMPLLPNDHLGQRVMIRTRTPQLEEKITMPEPVGHLVVLLNRQTIIQKMLPDISAKYFGGGDLRAAVNDREGNLIFGDGGNSSTPDASFALLDVTPDSMIFFTNRDVALPRAPATAKETVVLDQRIESRIFTREDGANTANGKEFTIKLQGDPKSVTHRTVVASTSANGDPWKLNVTHSAGSVGQFITNEHRKSMAIGIGLYLLLVGGIAAIVLSAMRSRKFAQRQIDFVSSVSHEFRTPLAVIYSAGENLADGVANDEKQITRYGELIKGEGRKLSTMVEQILEFAGASSGKKKYKFEPADAGSIVNEAIAATHTLLNDAGFTTEIEIADGLPQINADTEALSSAIQNLLQNSVKYSGDRRAIRVAATNGNSKVKISVEDNGIGIAGKDLRQLFEPFYRSKEVVDAQIHGNGLGLALVKEIAEAHGGTVRAESELGKGSNFTIEIPTTEKKN